VAQGRRRDAPRVTPPNSSFKPKTNRCAIVFGLTQALALMTNNIAISSLLLLIAASVSAADDPGPGGQDILVQEFSFVGSLGPWKRDNTYPIFWARPWKHGYEVLVAERFKCGTQKSSRPRAKLDGQQLALWVDLTARPWDRGHCEYRSSFKIDNLPKHFSPVIINGVYGIPQQGWPER